MAVERVSEKHSSPWVSESLSRYHFAAPYVSGKAVLDLACGTGLGVPVLLQAGAASVVGIDASEEAVREASLLASPRFAVIQADATTLPLPDESVDVVTSFETIEHIPDYELFLREVRRVLASGGQLLLSTPNALHTRPERGQARNPYHVREFTPDELKRILERQFRRVRILGQRVHPTYRPCPYWERPDLMRGVADRMRALIWKLENRLPQRPGSTLSRLAHGRGVLPGAHDFVFIEDEVESGHVILAVCE